MGNFSRIFADTGRALKVGEAAYVICPDGNHIFEESYDGYGKYDGKDIYELVVDWNREHIPQLFGDRNIEFPTVPADDYAKAISQGDEVAYEFLSDYLDPESWSLRDWKRKIGILLACYDDDNAGLPFPIKIASSNQYSYDELPASESDPGQGLGR